MRKNIFACLFTIHKLIIWKNFVYKITRKKKTIKKFPKYLHH